MAYKDMVASLAVAVKQISETKAESLKKVATAVNAGDMTSSDASIIEAARLINLEKQGAQFLNRAANPGRRGRRQTVVNVA